MHILEYAWMVLQVKWNAHFFFSNHRSWCIDIHIWCFWVSWMILSVQLLAKYKIIFILLGRKCIYKNTFLIWALFSPLCLVDANMLYDVVDHYLLPLSDTELKYIVCYDSCSLQKQYTSFSKQICFLPEGNKMQLIDYYPVFLVFEPEAQPGPVCVEYLSFSQPSWQGTKFAYEILAVFRRQACVHLQNHPLQLKLHC